VNIEEILNKIKNSNVKIKMTNQNAKCVVRGFSLVQAGAGHDPKGSHYAYFRGTA
jgi:hypothetical protein